VSRPEHVNPGSKDRRSKAPYNFVPLPEAVLCSPDWSPDVVRHDRYILERNTGWIDIALTAETPLFVRCAPDVAYAGDPDEKTNIHRRHFFHHGNESRPVIPGSSIRGMTRSLVEIMAYGKMQWVSNKDLMYRAVADQTNLGDVYRDTMLGPNLSEQSDQEMKFEYPIPRLKGGYLKRKASQCFIHSAKVVKGETFVHIEYKDVEPIIGDRGRQCVHDIYVLPATRQWVDKGLRGKVKNQRRLLLNLAVTRSVSQNEKDGYLHAKLVESGHMGKGIGETPDLHQKHMHCAIYDPDPDAEPIRIPFDMWVRYQDDLSISRGEKTDTRRLSDGDPLFYLLDNDGKLVFFGPTMLFRLPYAYNAASYVPDCLKRTEDVDLAEAIFGTVKEKDTARDDETLTIKGRVFFEDAVWDGQGNNPFLTGNNEFKSPKILSSPKPTAFQHYLVQPDKSKLRHYDSGPEATEIRGHKLYWHKKDVPEADMFEPNIMMDKQHTIVRPVRSGTCFKTRIRFENLNDIELGALLSALNLCPSMRHKIGMSKPYGMGSVKIETTLRLTDPKSRYKRVCTDDGGLEFGLKSDPEIVRIKEACVKEFNELVRAHDKKRLSGDDGTIWSIPRIARLGRMLEWNGAPPRIETDYVGLDKDGAKWWRQRRVLLTPEGVVNASGPSVANRPGPSAPHATMPHPAIKSGTRVHCLLLEEKTKKGGWKAQTIEGSLKGHILPDNEPLGIKPGDRVELVIHGTDPKNLSFRWPRQ